MSNITMLLTYFLLCVISSLDVRGYVGAYSPEQRRKRIEKFLEKRNRRVWTKKVKYDVRKNFADSRLRVKVRFYILLFSFHYKVFISAFNFCFGRVDL